MNKIIFVLLITFTQNGFAIIHNRTSNFIDIEFETNKLFFECSHHPENDTSYLAFEFIENENYYFFNYRKPLSIKLCNEAMLEYKKIIKDAKTVRIVGISPDYEPMKNIKNLTYPKPFYIHLFQHTYDYLFQMKLLMILNYLENLLGHQK